VTFPTHTFYLLRIGKKTKPTARNKCPSFVVSFTVQIHWQRCFSVEKVNQTALLALLTQHTRPSGRTGQSYVEFVRNLIQQQQQQHCQRNILEEEKGRDGEFLVSKFNMLKRGKFHLFGGPRFDTL
jgi:transposase-like protein